VAASALVRTARRRAGLTQVELGRRAGVSQAEVARIEHPGSNPTAATLERVLRGAGFRMRIEPVEEVDESQLRERLRLTPAQRLAAFQASQRSLTQLLTGARRVGPAAS
jgi:transcriptional regulator with XRE-family HTH domain